MLPIDGTNCYPMVPLSKDDVAYIDGLIRRRTPGAAITRLGVKPRPVRGAGGRVDAGINRLRVAGPGMLRPPGRWQLVVDPADDGNAASRNYRVVRK